MDYILARSDPHYLDISNKYPVLAIYIKNAEMGYARRGIPGLRGVHIPNVNMHKFVFLKITYFLTADQEGNFRWLGQSGCGLFRSEPGCFNPELIDRPTSRYSMINKDFREWKNMIYPVRPFSITGIEIDGFSPSRAYPVLAIDIDQYLSDNPESKQEEELEKEEVTEQSPVSMAFFLVGDDNGEFAWIAEDECKLFPLTTEKTSLD